MIQVNEAIANIFTVNLGVKRQEKVLVITDRINPEERPTADERARREDLVDIAADVAEAGRAFCRPDYIEFASVMGHGKEPPVEVWTAAFGVGAVEELTRAGLMDKLIRKVVEPAELKAAEEIVKRLASSPDAVIALSNFSTSHTRFRDFLTRLKGARYASMPLFERRMLDTVMTADWSMVEKKTLRILDLMAGAEEVYITSHNGTSISFSVKGRRLEADTGILTEKGRFGNLPAGEAFLAPVEGTAEGTLVLEWGPLGRFRRPVELDVKGGMVAEVSGNGEPFAEELKRRLQATPLAGNIAELGIGTNDKAERPDNILETEKILGTVHIAIGDNSAFGGKVSVPYHQDFIFFRPTLEAIRGEDKIPVLTDGRPNF